MRKVILLMHVSLDGFTAGPNGEMNWIKVDDEMFEIVSRLTNESDTALFGRVTYKMMESYWPNAGKEPNASKHDIEHADWLNNNEKIVFSDTLKETPWEKTTIMNGNIKEKVESLKKQPGKNMLMIGSTETAHHFMQNGLIDEYFININPVVLGEGKPMFKDIKNKINLKLISSTTFKPGIVGLHYETIK